LKKSNPAKEYLKYSSLGLEVLASILIFVGLGYGLDKWLATEKPWFLLFCSLFGCFLAIYLLVRRFSDQQKP